MKLLLPLIAAMSMICATQPAMSMIYTLQPTSSVQVSGSNNAQAQEKYVTLISDPKAVALISQVSTLIRTANAEYKAEAYGAARNQVQAVMTMIQSSTQIQPVIQNRILGELNNFLVEIQGMRECQMKPGSGCSGNEDHILLLSALQQLGEAARYMGPQAGAPIVVPQIPGNGPIGLPVVPNPAFPGPIQPGIPGQPGIIPGQPGFFQPHYGQATLPFLDATVEQILSFIGVLKVDYGKRNRELRAKYGFRNNDYLADKIINKHASLAATATFGTNIFAVIPVVGYGISMAAFPMDLLYTIQNNVEMTLQLADLYYSGLTPTDIRHHAILSFGATFALKSLNNFHKSYVAANSTRAAGSFVGRQVGTLFRRSNFITSAIEQGVVTKTAQAGATTKPGEKVLVITGTGIFKALTQLNGQVVKILAAKQASVAGVWVGAGVTGALTAMTYSWTYGVGKGMKTLYRSYHKDYRKESIDNFKMLMQNQEFAMPFISLLVGAINASTEDIADIQGDDHRLVLMNTLMNNLGITEDASSVYLYRLFDFYRTELESETSTLPTELKGRLKKSYIANREFAAEIMLTIMLSGDQYRTVAERKYFKGVVLPELGLNTEAYEDFYDGMDHFIVQQNKGIQPKKGSFLGYETELLQNPSPLIGGAKRSYMRRCRKAQDCKKRIEQPIGKKLGLTSPKRYQTKSQSEFNQQLKYNTMKAL